MHTREFSDRNLGWSSLDARDHAERDLVAGKFPPIEQALLGRRVPN